MSQFRKETILSRLRFVIVKLAEARKMLHETLVEILALGVDGDDVADEVIRQLADLAAADPPLDNETIKRISALACKNCKNDYDECRACGFHIFINSLKTAEETAVLPEQVPKWNCKHGEHKHGIKKPKVGVLA